VDAYLAGQRSAALIVLHDGKLRLERYGLDFDSKGRWTSFSVAKSITSTLVGAGTARRFHPEHGRQGQRLHP
jgi:CubicO group peptidase (beta-lactamase class C family)